VEIEVLREAIGNEDPFVVENGGAAYIPRGYFERAVVGRERELDPSGRYEVIRWGVPYHELVAALDEARRRTGAGLRGYSDVGVEALARMTNLSLEEARRSMDREFDEPFWVEEQEDERSRNALDWLTARKLTVTRGGRFYHLMGGCDKGRAVSELLNVFRMARGPLVSAGLGDAGNDLAFLRVVDNPYIVARRDGSHDPALVKVVSGARRVGPAPGGWAEAIQDFLADREKAR
jgi:mannosyl-3-phosphoglycerate phosphatase